MYGVSADVFVRSVEHNKKILIEWPTQVDWVFTPRRKNATCASISDSGFGGDDDQKVKQALDSMIGFSFLLAGRKAFLECGIRLNLVADHNPHALKKHSPIAL